MPMISRNAIAALGAALVASTLPAMAQCRSARSSAASGGGSARGARGGGARHLHRLRSSACSALNEPQNG